MKKYFIEAISYFEFIYEVKEVYANNMKEAKKMAKEMYDNTTCRTTVYTDKQWNEELQADSEKRRADFKLKRLNAIYKGQIGEKRLVCHRNKANHKIIYSRTYPVRIDLDTLRIAERKKLFM